MGATASHPIGAIDRRALLHFRVTLNPRCFGVCVRHRNMRDIDVVRCEESGDCDDLADSHCVSIHVHAHSISQIASKQTPLLSRLMQSYPIRYNSVACIAWHSDHTLHEFERPYKN